VLAGERPLSGVQPLLDSTPAWCARDARALRAALWRNGYLHLRGLLPGAQAARDALLSSLGREAPAAFAGDARGGVAAPGAASIGLLSRQHLAQAAEVRAVTEHAALFELADALLPPTQGCQTVLTPAFKWARAVAPGEWTGVHADAKYITAGGVAAQAGRRRGGCALTFWLPLGHVSLRMGGLLVASGSHRAAHLAPALGRYLAQPLGADGAASGWLAASAADVRSSQPLRWCGSDVESGDVIVLRLDTLHQSATNSTALVRTSVDTRWSRAGAARDARLREWRDGAGETHGA